MAGLWRADVCPTVPALTVVGCVGPVGGGRPVGVGCAGSGRPPRIQTTRTGRECTGKRKNLFILGPLTTLSFAFWTRTPEFSLCWGPSQSAAARSQGPAPPPLQASVFSCGTGSEGSAGKRSWPPPHTTGVPREGRASALRLPPLAPRLWDDPGWGHQEPRGPRLGAPGAGTQAGGTGGQYDPGWGTGSRDDPGWGHR